MLIQPTSDPHPPSRSPRRKGHVYLHLYLLAVLPLSGADEPGVRCLFRRFKPYHVALVLRAAGLGQGQQVNSLKEVALALRVCATEHGQPRTEVQLHVCVVAEVFQAQVFYVHRLVKPCWSSQSRFPLRGCATGILAATERLWRTRGLA